MPELSESEQKEILIARAAAAAARDNADNPISVMPGLVRALVATMIDHEPEDEVDDVVALLRQMHWSAKVHKKTLTPGWTKRPIVEC